MKNTVVIAFVNMLLISSSLYAQSPTFEWVKQIGGVSDDDGRSITTDASGNIYTTGQFSDTTDFDPGPGITNLTSVGSRDIFIQKLDSNGGLLWVKQMGGISHEIGYSITVDVNENVYTTGFFTGTVDFDPGIGIANLTSYGVDDIFVQKLDTNGNLLWVNQMGGAYHDYGISITTDINENVYVAGFFHGIVDFDPGLGTTTLISEGSADVFIQKLDANGNLVWVKQIGGPGTDVVSWITTGVSGNIYTTGTFSDTTDFDPGPGVTNLTSVGETDIYIQKLDTNGNLLWVRQMGGIDYDEGLSISTDANENVYTTGVFRATVDFDPGAGTAGLTTSGFQDIFIQKLDSNGNLLWAKQVGGTDDETAISITTDQYENAYIAGYFKGSPDFDPGTGTTILTSAGNYDTFILKLNVDGSFIWVVQMGGASLDYSNSITVDDNGSLFSTGAFQGTVDFDPGAGVANLTYAGSTDIFIQKLSQCPPTTGTDTVTACNSHLWIDGNTYTSSNNTATSTISSAAGCDSVITLNLTINNVSDITTSLSGMTISANLTAAYVWLDCDNNYSIIVGETSQSYSPTTNGNYAVELTENGCVDTTACVAINTIGLEERSFLGNFIVYPNPAVETLTISLVKKPVIQGSVIVLNAVGQKVISTKISKKSQLLNVEILPEGLYIVEITVDGESSIHRFIKK